jgi:hypothetical protein
VWICILHVWPQPCYVTINCQHHPHRVRIHGRGHCGLIVVLHWEFVCQLLPCTACLAAKRAGQAAPCRWVTGCITVSQLLIVVVLCNKQQRHRDGAICTPQPMWYLLTVGRRQI